MDLLLTCNCTGSLLLKMLIISSFVGSAFIYVPYHNFHSSNCAYLQYHNHHIIIVSRNFKSGWYGFLVCLTKGATGFCQSVLGVMVKSYSG